MFSQDRAEQMAGRLRELLENSPAKDLEKNCRAFANAMLGKMNVVTREEFDEQSRLLEEAITKLNGIEEQLRQLAGGGVAPGAPRKKGRARKETPPPSEQEQAPEG